jgi:CheY-like chemotaxis protein
MDSAVCVLLIDNDDVIRHLVTTTLREEGYETVAVPDAVSALHALDRCQPRLILLDSAPHRSTDRDFLTAYRGTPGPHAPVILFTAAMGAAELARELAVDGLLAKPFDVEDLLALAGRYDCDHQSSPAQPAPPPVLASRS